MRTSPTTTADGFRSHVHTTFCLAVTAVLCVAVLAPFRASAQQPLIADNMSGTDWCAKVMAADAAFASLPGEIWISQRAGTSPCAGNISLSDNHVLRFTQGGTYALGSATITLGNNTAVLCTSWATILSYTGSADNALSVTGHNSTISGCKFDDSGGGPYNIIKATGDDFVLDGTWILGAATDSQSSHNIFIGGARSISRNNRFDTVSGVEAAGGMFRGSSDTFVNYRTGYYVKGANNSIIQAPQCLSTAGSGVKNGLDCVLTEDVSWVEIDNPVVKASREHGIYVGGGAGTSIPSTNIKIMGGTYTGFTGVAIKVLGQTSNVGVYHKAIQIVAPTIDSSTGTGVNATGVFISGCVNCEVSGGSVRNVVYGVDIGGAVDNVDVHDVISELNQADGIRLADYNGPIQRTRIHDNHLLNNSQTLDIDFVGIELAPGRSTVGFASTEIVIDGNRCDSTLGPGQPRQRYCIGLNGVSSNGSTVSGLEIAMNRSTGTGYGTVSNVPTGYSNVTQWQNY